jgi:hypothetical protein
MVAFRLWPRRTPTAAAVDGRLRQSRHVLATAQGDELVLLDLKGERYYTLNAVGSRAWTLLAGGATRDQIVEVIRREYDVPMESDGDPVERDVTRLLAELHAAGLVVADGPTGVESR